MGWLDKAKGIFGGSKGVAGGLGGSQDAHPSDASPKSKDPRRKDGRPPLREVAPTSTATLDDALAARDAGDRAKARAILASIDKGQGLRTVLRAAAALEAGDEEELQSLLSTVSKE